MQDEPIIQTKELTKSYGPHVALDKLNPSTNSTKSQTVHFFRKS